MRIVKMLLTLPFGNPRGSDFIFGIIKIDMVRKAKIMIMDISVAVMLSLHYHYVVLKQGNNYQNNL